MLIVVAGNYVLKPYNFFLDPVPNEKLHVERIFSYQSGGRKCRYVHG